MNLLYKRGSYHHYKQNRASFRANVKANVKAGAWLTGNEAGPKQASPVPNTQNHMTKLHTVRLETAYSLAL